MMTTLATLIFLVTLLFDYQPKGHTLALPHDVCLFHRAIIALLLTFLVVFFVRYFDFCRVILISLILDKVGLFEWSAIHMLHASKAMV